MKHFFKSAFYLTLLLSSVGALLADCNSNDCFNRGSCGFNNTNNCNPCSTNNCDPCFNNKNNCNTGCFNNSCNNNNCNDSCDFSCNNNDCNFNCDGYSNNCFNLCGDQCSSDDCSACCSTPIRTHVHFRSVGANTARELVGWQWELNRPFMCENYGAAYIAYEYQRSFRSERLARALFGAPTLRFSGSLVPNRDPRTELLADNFGLSRTFRGSVTFFPRVENHTVDLGYYLGLDCFLQGSYLRIHMPINHARWSLNPCECLDTAGSTTADACYFGSDGLTANTPGYATDVAPTQTAASLQQALSGTFLFGDMQTPWCSGRFDYCRRTRTGLADIDLIFGYNWLNTDCYHLGAYAQLVLPTGRKPKNLFVFDPVVGNGGHFELGAGLSFHSVFWSCENQNLALFFEGNITHMFKNRQCRLFDFCNNGAFSRYLLLKQYDSNGVVNTYNGSLISATCLANREVDVRLDVKGDFSVKLAYRWCNWGLDLGYNLYGHSREKIEWRCDDDCNDCGPRQRVCPKGTEGVCCFNYPVVCVPTNGTVDPTIFPDNATLPGGTLQCSTTAATPCDFDNPAFTGPYRVTTAPNSACQPDATAFRPAPVVNPNPTTGSSNACVVSLAPNSPQVTSPTLVSSLPGGFILCNNNNPVRFFDPRRDLNKQSAEAVSVLTHKIFAFFNYTCYDECGWNPHLGLGASVEFDGGRRNNETCAKTDLNQWGILVKGGFSF